MKKPLVFDFIDAGSFLKEFYKHRKCTERNFSYESWALELGVKSRSYLRSVIIGKRSLSDQLIPQFCSNLKFTSEESQYFNLLAKYSLCKTIQTRELLAKQLVGFQQKKLQMFEITDSKEFLLDPLSPVVFTLLGEEGVHKNAQSLAQCCDLELCRMQSILVSLLKLKLVTSYVCAVTGDICYSTTCGLFKVPDLPKDQFLNQFHIAGLEQAFKACDMPYEMRRFRSLFFSLNQEDIGTAQNLINEFAVKVLAQFSKKSETRFNVYRLNLQLFPVTQEIQAAEIRLNQPQL